MHLAISFRDSRKLNIGFEAYRRIVSMTVMYLHPFLEYNFNYNCTYPEWEDASASHIQNIKIATDNSRVLVTLDGTSIFRPML